MAPGTTSPATTESPLLDAPALAEAVFGRRLDRWESAELDRFWRTDWAENRLSLGDAADRSLAATAVSFGTPVFHGFGPGYALTFHPDAEVVRAVGHALRRPRFTPSLLTTREHLLSLVDTDELHPSPERFAASVDERLTRGAVAVGVPAAAGLPAHLTTRVDGVPTVEVVIPGADCPSLPFLATALERTGGTHLATTTPRGLTPDAGRPGPVLDRIAAIQREFGRMRPGAVMLAHRSEWRARRRQRPVQQGPVEQGPVER